MHFVLSTVEVVIIVIRGHRHLFFVIVFIETMAEIIGVIVIIAEVVVVRGGSKKLDRVVEHHRHSPRYFALLTSHYFLFKTYDATKNIFTSWHEILATGCIQALPMASNLFCGVAHRVAPRFFLEAMLFVFAFRFIDFVRADVPDFDPECFVETCAAPLPRGRVELAARDSVLFRDALPRTRI
jgi:hypothetical protein